MLLDFVQLTDNKFGDTTKQEIALIPEICVGIEMSNKLLLTYPCYMLRLKLINILVLPSLFVTEFDCKDIVLNCVGVVAVKIMPDSLC